jgi:hypothetical protein
MPSVYPMVSCHCASVKNGSTYDLLARGAVAGNFLTLRTSELLRASAERLVEVVLSACTCALVGVVHLGNLIVCLRKFRVLEYVWFGRCIR